MNNFTPQAQQVLAHASKISERFKHNYIGTEHLILGMIKFGQGVVISALQSFGSEVVDELKKKIEEQLVEGGTISNRSNIPYTPRVKKVLTLANEKAKSLGHSYVGTEHILLGVIAEGEGVAATALKSLGLNEEDVQKKIQEVLGTPDKVVNKGLNPQKKLSSEWKKKLDFLYRELRINDFNALCENAGLSIEEEFSLRAAVTE